MSYGSFLFFSLIGVQSDSIVPHHPSTLGFGGRVWVIFYVNIWAFLYQLLYKDKFYPIKADVVRGLVGLYLPLWRARDKFLHPWC